MVLMLMVQGGSSHHMPPMMAGSFGLRLLLPFLAACFTRLQYPLWPNILSHAMQLLQLQTVNKTSSNCKNFLPCSQKQPSHSFTLDTPSLHQCPEAA